MAIALARSLVGEQRCNAAAAASAYGAAFDRSRVYRQFDRNVYLDLRDGEDYRETSGRWGPRWLDSWLAAPAWQASAAIGWHQQASAGIGRALACDEGAAVR
jgi:hypothetical protein